MASNLGGNRMEQIKKHNNYNYYLKLPSPIYSIYKYLFKDITFIYNASKLIYAIAFVALLTFCWIGLTQKLITGYFEIMVIAFIMLYSLWFADNRISNSQGIFQLTGFIFLAFWIVGMLNKDYTLGFRIMPKLISFIVIVFIVKGFFWLLKIQVQEKPKRRKYDLKRK